MLNAFQLIAEEQIQRAIRSGSMDNLQGQGKPLEFQENPYLPEDSRMAYKVLKNAGYIPAELEQRKEIAVLEEAIAHEKDEAVKLRQIKKLSFLVSKLASAGYGSLLSETNSYYDKLVDSISVTDR